MSEPQATLERLLRGARGLIESAIAETWEAARRTAGRQLPASWWRVGYFESPLEFVPREFCSWEHRFDDPEREYRTLYCGEHKLTCLREVLADLRPNTSARAEFAQFQLAQGIPADELSEPARVVTIAWRRRHVLARARLAHDGPLVEIDDVQLRQQLERAHAELLRSYGMDHLDLSEIRSQNRAVTQAISRDLHDQGAAGILFRSNLDDQRCIVAFEHRASLQPADDAPTELTGTVPELLQVCHEFGLLVQA